MEVGPECSFRAQRISHAYISHLLSEGRSHAPGASSGYYESTVCADTLLAVIPPRAPPKHLHSACDSSAGEPGSWDDPARFRCSCWRYHVLVLRCGRSSLIQFQIVQQGLYGQSLMGAMQCRLPANASATKKRVAAFLKQRLRIPDVALIVLFSVRPWAWALLAAWLVGAPLASRMEVRGAHCLSP